jgi:DHA1 family multidrug resistance protein-like MFS transporter
LAEPTRTASAPSGRRRFWADYLAITAITSAEGTGGLLVPLLLNDSGYSAAAIGPLVAIIGVASLASRFPAGAAYRPSRARWLLAGSIIAAAASSVFYPFVVMDTPLFALVRTINGLAEGTATTVNLALFIDSLPPGLARARGMGLYGGGMAAGFMIGNLTGGFMAGVFGYPAAFALGALFWLIALLQALLTPEPAAAHTDATHSRRAQAPVGRLQGIRSTLKALGDPRAASVILVAFSLNALHQIGHTFFPVLARNIGLELGEIGFIRSAHAMVNAIARPISSPLIGRLGAQGASLSALFAQSVLLAFVPLMALGGFPALLLIFLLIGSTRALGFTANATALAEDIPESRLSRGLSTSLFTAAKDIGNIAGPLIGSALTPIIGFAQMFVGAPVLLLVFYVGVIAWARKERKVMKVKK